MKRNFPLPTVRIFIHHEGTNDCMDAGDRQKIAPAFSAYLLHPSGLAMHGAIVDDTKFKFFLRVLRAFVVNLLVFFVISLFFLNYRGLNHKELNHEYTVPRP